MDNIRELKVSKNTEPKKLAGTIKYYIQKGDSCKLLALGQQPICISVKSIALLSSMFNINYSCHISYFHQNLSDSTITGIQFLLNI